MPSYDKLMQRLSQPFDRYPKFLQFLQIMLVGWVSVLTFNAVGTLIYGALGQFLPSMAGKYSVVLYGVMLLATIAFTITQYWPQNRLFMAIAQMAAGAVVGFYYGGTAVDLPPAAQAPWAVAGAVVGAVLCGVASWYKVWPMGLASLRTIVIYGAAFMHGAIGCMLLSVGNGWGWGVIGLMLVSLGMTVRSLFCL